MGRCGGGRLILTPQDCCGGRRHWQLSWNWSQNTGSCLGFPSSARGDGQGASIPQPGLTSSLGWGGGIPRGTGHTQGPSFWWMLGLCRKLVELCTEVLAWSRPHPAPHGLGPGKRHRAAQGPRAWHPQAGGHCVASWGPAEAGFPPAFPHGRVWGLEEAGEGQKGVGAASHSLADKRGHFAFYKIGTSHGRSRKGLPRGQG